MPLAVRFSKHIAENVQYAVSRSCTFAFPGSSINEKSIRNCVLIISFRIFFHRMAPPITGVELVYFSNHFGIVQIFSEQVWNEPGRKARIPPPGINAAGKKNSVVLISESLKIKRRRHLPTSISRKPRAADLNIFSS